ncbi:MAG: ATP-dependent metallopeptidase FtsH/Yme1/Tma family protein, partial [Pseudomonadales bacterium]
MAKNLILWLVIAAVLMAVFQNLNQSVPANELSYTDFVQQVQNGNVEEVTFQGSMIYGETSDGSSFQSVRP